MRKSLRPRQHQKILRHYEQQFGTRYQSARLPGPAHELGPGFRILVFPPRPGGDYWVYATVGMSAVPEALEQLFEEANFNYLDPGRASVV